MLLPVRAKASCNDGAGIAENLPINKMILIGQRSKRLKTVKTEDVLDATQYGVEEPREAFVESEDEQEQRTT